MKFSVTIGSAVILLSLATACGSKADSPDVPLILVSKAPTASTTTHAPKAPVVTHAPKSTPAPRPSATHPSATHTPQVTSAPPVHEALPVVVAGRFCSPEGAVGVNKHGVKLTCLAIGSDRARWRY